MKNIFNKLKFNILFYTLALVFIAVCSHFVLSLFNITFRYWFYFVVFLLFVIGIFSGLIQMIILNKKYYGKKTALWWILLIIFSIVIIPYICLAFILNNYNEHIVIRDGTKYVAYTDDIFQVEVNYYDYINFLVIGNQVKIFEKYSYDIGGYDPLNSNDEHYQESPLYYYKYDNSGNVISTDDDYYWTQKNANKNIPSDTENFQNTDYNSNNTLDNLNSSYLNLSSDKILYEKSFSNNISIRIVFEGSVLAQRSLISIAKTTDFGNSWHTQLENADHVLQIHNGAKFEFLTENIGFIYDPGISGTNYENNNLLVTLNGGKSFEKATFIKPDSLSNINLTINKLPFYSNNILYLEMISTNSYSQNSYYTFFSEDSGLTWKIKE